MSQDVRASATSAGSRSFSCFTPLKAQTFKKVEKITSLERKQTLHKAQANLVKSEDIKVFTDYVKDGYYDRIEKGLIKQDSICGHTDNMNRTSVIEKNKSIDATSPQSAYVEQKNPPDVVSNTHSGTESEL